MVEHDDSEKHQTAEELKQELLEYLKDADFGTPKYQALGDFLNLHDLEESLDSWQGSLVSESNARRKPYLESQLRLAELEVALLRHKIAISKSTTKGYGAAYTEIAATTEDISIKLSSEDKTSDKKLYKAGQRTVWNDLWGEYFKREG